jgi:hypothetical protein
MSLGGDALPAELLEPLLELSRDEEVATRQEALRALSRAAVPSAAALGALSRAARDPVESVRATVATLVAGAGGWATAILRRLLGDPAPRVRAAAAWSALARGEVEEQLLSELGEELDAASPEGQVSAALAAACLGAGDPRIGELLAPLSASLPTESESDWSGLGRFSGPSWPLAAWAASPDGRAAIYRRAVAAPSWLGGLGAALDSEFGRLDTAQGELRDGLRGGAVLLLRGDDEVLRLRAARVLGAYLDGDARAVDLLLVNEPTAEVLRLLSLLTAELSLIRPRWVERLLPCLSLELADDEAGEAPAALAMSCLGGLADPRDGAVGRALAAQVAGPQGDAAYRALCRLLSRTTLCG